MKKVVVITGPTGVGKTSIAIELAKIFKAEIISADSAQVYQELNIGTAKIKEEDKEGIKHHLIDIVAPTETYDVATYQRDARKLIKGIERPFLVGGTGLYLKATLNDYDFSGAGRDFDFEEQYAKYTNEELHKLLEKKDYQASLTIHPNNRRRVLRALNAKKTKRKAKDKPVYDYLIFELALPRDVLYDKINLRVLKMIDAGLVEEVKTLKEKGLTYNIICYKQINDYLDEKLTLDEAIKEIQKVTRRYAKRQQTWFKNQMETILVDVTDKQKAILEIKKRVEEVYK